MLLFYVLKYIIPWIIVAVFFLLQNVKSINLLFSLNKINLKLNVQFHVSNIIK